MIAAVVLAAGASERLGRPKQLLVHRGRTLVRHAVECALGGGCRPVIVVLGARADELRSAVDGTEAQVVRNEGWARGLGSSVAAGVRAVAEGRPPARGTVLLACDQPLLTADLVRALVERHAASGARLVACRYADTVGVPALFDRSLFPELLALDGPHGAKPVLLAHAAELSAFDWPAGAADVDTPGDAGDLGP